MRLPCLPQKASLLVQSVKNLPAMQETWVRFLGQEDPLEKEMAIQFSIFAWRIPWTEEPGKLQSTGAARIGHDLATKLLLGSYNREKESRMAVVKRPGREKPTKIEQRKVGGLE